MAMAMAMAMPASFSTKSTSLARPPLPQHLYLMQPRPIPGEHASLCLSVRRAAAFQQPQSICMRSRLMVGAGSRNRQGEAVEAEGVEEPPNTGAGNMPARYAKYLKPPKKSPNYILWASGILIVLIMRKTIMIELLRWAWGGAVLGAILLDAAQYCFSWLLEHAREYVVWSATLTGWVWFAITDIYGIILGMTPVKGLVKAIVCSLAVLSLGEAVQSDAVSRQADALGIATLMGLAGILGLLDPASFTLALGVLTMYLALIRRAGLLGTAIPAIAVLVAVAEPIVQTLAFALFLVITLYTNYTRNYTRDDSKKNAAIEKQKLPAIFTVAALAVGIRVAAEWLYARHLVWLAT